MPLHFLWGEEDFLIEKAITKIKEEVLKGDVNDLNYRTFDSPDFPLFCELIRTNAMMFSDIVIAIKCQNYFLTTKNKKELDEKQTQELIHAFQNISQKVHIILICQTPRGENKKPDSRKKLYKEIQKIAKLQEFPSYKNYEEYKLIPIIKKMAQDAKLKISDKVCSQLIQTTGSSLRIIDSQLEKLKLYAYPKNEITSKMVENVAVHTVDIFSVIDFVLKKDYSKALNLISENLQKEHYLPTFALIQTMINNLIKTKIYSASFSSYDIAKKIGQKEFRVKKNLEKIKNTPLSELTRLKINLTNIDYLLKTGKLNDPLTGYELAFLSLNLEEYL